MAFYVLQTEYYLENESKTAADGRNMKPKTWNNQEFLRERIKKKKKKKKKIENRAQKRNRIKWPYHLQLFHCEQARARRGETANSLKFFPFSHNYHLLNNNNPLILIYYSLFNVQNVLFYPISHSSTIYVYIHTHTHTHTRCSTLFVAMKEREWEKSDKSNQQNGTWLGIKFSIKNHIFKWKATLIIAQATTRRKCIILTHCNRMRYNIGWPKINLL